MTRAETSDPDRLWVAEMFTSLQGESSFVGLPCTFVRLAGCDLGCTWCDTPQARSGGEPLRRSTVRERVLAAPTELCAVTGGEPMLQAATLPLLQELCDARRTVLLETNGAHDLSAVDPRVHRIVDLKAPSSGCSEHNHLDNLSLLTARDELKFVLASRQDYDWMRALIRREGIEALACAVLVSCVWGELEPRQLAAWLLEDRLQLRLQVQLHKIIWGPDAKGV